MKYSPRALSYLENIIKPALTYLSVDKIGDYSAANLLLGTAAQESHLGEYVAQINGPALGIYQMEPATYKDILTNYVKYKDILAARLFFLSSPICSEENIYSNPSRSQAIFILNSLNNRPNLLVYNNLFATGMARLHYLRVPEKLPRDSDIPALAAYWKKYYNTRLGKGTEEEFIKNFNRLILGK